MTFVLSIKNHERQKQRIMKNLIKKSLVILTVAVAASAFAQKANDVEYVSLKGDAVFPEGIHALPNGQLLVGGFGDGSIQQIDKEGNVSYFSAPGENGMVIAVGMAIDESRNRLWVANFNFNTGDGTPGSQIKVFDLNTKEVVKTIPEDFIKGSFFNEVAIDKKGNIYISDTFNPQIWTAKADLSGVEVLVNNDLLSNPAPDQPFDLNGLAITPNNKYLIASVMDRLDAGDGKLVKINLDSKEVSPIALSGEKAVKGFAGSDGMFFAKGQLFMVNVYSAAGAIITADFNKDYSSAALTVRDAYQDVYDRPTASAISGGKLWTVNSQLDHIIDDANGAKGTPHQTPFEIVGVPVAELLKK